MTKSLAKTLLILSSVVLLALLIIGIVQSFQMSALRNQASLAEQRAEEMQTKLEEVDKDFIEFKAITRYAVSEDEITIYEYYLKCDTTTNVCFNDEARDSLSDITYTIDFNINNYLNSLTIYEHTFKYNSENDSYYWYSSQMA